MRLSRLLLDVAPLRRYPDFGRLWSGQLVSGFGGQLTVYAVMLQAFEISGSALAVGGVGLSFVLPSVGTALVGGGLIDAFDRRRIVLVTSSLQAGVSMLLAVQAFAGLDSLAVLYGLVALQGAVGAVNAPARGTFMPRLIPADQLHAGAALEGFAMHVGAIAGPAAAGVISAAVGLKTCFVIDAASFAAALYGVWRLPSMRPESATTRMSARSVFEGFRYVTQNRIVGQAFLADMALTVLGTPTALLPALNESRFGGRAEVLGFLLAATAVGGLLGTACSGALARVEYQGRVMVLLCGGWGLAVALVGLSPRPELAIQFLVVAGALDSLVVVLRSAVVQASLPDAVRGRIGSLDHVVGVGGPQLGSFRGGALGAGIGPAAAVLVGGLSTAGASWALLVGARKLVSFTRPGAASEAVANDASS